MKWPLITRRRHQKLLDSQRELTSQATRLRRDTAARRDQLFGDVLEQAVKIEGLILERDTAVSQRDFAQRTSQDFIARGREAEEKLRSAEACLAAANAKLIVADRKLRARRKKATR